MIPIARPAIGSEEEEAVLAVLRSGVLAQAGRVKDLEERFAELTGARHAVATSNGTTALQLALMAHGIGHGDEVITSPLTFIASANAIVHAGARPVFADVDDTLNLDPRAAEAAITPRTRAILPVHLHGNPAALSAFEAICRRHGLVLIQDACQAVGASLGGRRLGEFGTACFSLYATKNVTTGEGGMIVTDEGAVAEAAASLRHQGYSEVGPYIHDRIGFNHRMSEVHAAIGVAQLEKLAAINARRRDNAAFYDEALAESRLFRRPRRLPGAVHVFHQYVLRVAAGAGSTRDEVRAHLAERGVATGVHYPIPVHLQPAYRHLERVSCPEAEAAAGDMVSIPVHPGVSAAEREQVVSALRALESAAPAAAGGGPRPR